MYPQIYLLLTRSREADFATMLVNAILGDSTDLPFLKWIKVKSVAHSIKFKGSESEQRLTAEGSPTQTITTRSGTSVGSYRQRGTPDHETGEESVYDRYGNRGGEPPQRTRFKTYKSKLNNWNVKIDLPSHSSFTFTKNIDNATPQLAFANAAQEPLKNAIFAFRRKIGTGVRGVRVPYMLMWMKKCLVTSWELDGDEEKVTLSYRLIRWATYDQVTDWNVPTGMSARFWDKDQSEGGESLKMYGIMAAIAGVAVAAAAVDEIASSATGSSGIQRGSGTSHTDFIE